MKVDGRNQGWNMTYPDTYIIFPMESEGGAVPMVMTIGMGYGSSGINKATERLGPDVASSSIDSGVSAICRAKPVQDQAT